MSGRVKKKIRDFLGSIPRVIGVLAGLATIVTLIVVLVRDGDSPPELPKRNGGPTIVVPITPPTLDPSRTLPDFLVSEVKSCVVKPSTSGNDIAVLSLNFKIINRGNFVFEPNDVFIAALSDQGLDAHKTEYLAEDSWVYDYVLKDWASDSVDLDLELKSSNFGKLHRIIVAVDSTGIGRGSQVVEHDEFNNETVVLVLLPEEPLKLDEWITIRCNAP